MICQICGKDFKSASHIKKKHNIDSKTYYDTYLGNIGTCKICGKPTAFDGINVGYKTYCSIKCAQNDPEVRNRVTANTKKNLKEKFGVENVQQILEIRNRTKQTCLERYGTEYAIASKEVKDKIISKNQLKYGVDYPLQSKEIKQKSINTLVDNYGVDNPMFSTEVCQKVINTKIQNKNKFINNNDYVLLSDIGSLYGQGWYHNRDNLGITIIKNGIYAYISKEDAIKAKNYYDTHYLGHLSFIEYKLLNFIKLYYLKDIISPTRKIIKPYELDIYIPDLKLAIEYNGNYWHSIKNNSNKNYHLMKSLLCRNKNIRLIHIYEFEDFEQQKQLLKDLILGTDNYPKNEFNKNNLIDFIPESEIIYQNDKFTIYGAGKLY